MGLPGRPAEPTIGVHLAVLREPGEVSGPAALVCERTDLPQRLVRRRLPVERVRVQLQQSTSQLITCRDREGEKTRLPRMETDLQSQNFFIGG